MKNKVLKIYPATSLQQGFIYHALRNPSDDAYRVQVLYDYNTPLDIKAYLASWEACIAEYPILRTAFNWKEDLIQVVYKKGNLNYTIHDLSELSEDLRKEKVKEIQELDRTKEFDLTKPTLLRLHIIKHSNSYYTILKSEHHSVSDGWSGPVLLQRLHAHYHAILDGRQLKFQEDTAYLEAQDYIFKHKKTISKYWEDQLSIVEHANNIEALLTSPIDLSSYTGANITEHSKLSITAELYDKVKTFTRKEGITVSALVQFLWHKLIQVYSASNYSIVGTVVSGRDLPITGIENSVGLYINTLPLVVNWENKQSISSILKQIQESLSGINSHSFTELAKLQKSGNQLFNSLLTFENYPISKTAQGISSKMRVRSAIEKTNYPLSILAYEAENSQLNIQLDYDSLLLTKTKAQDHLNTLKHILNQVIDAPNRSHKELSLLSDASYNEIIYDWNATDVDYPKEETIVSLFQAQVTKNPDQIALVYEDQKLSYKELNEKSNQLAVEIRKTYKTCTGKDLQADTLIALCLERSLEMVISILGVLKAGGAYVPIDPTYPQDRIDFMLEDTASALVLTQASIAQDQLAYLSADQILIIDLQQPFYKLNVADNLSIPIQSKDLSYVIYTSGTTGTPKGVMIEHASILSLVCNDYINVESTDVFAFLASPSFDAATFEIWTPLLNGNSLVIPSNVNELVSNILNFETFITKNAISILWLNKTLFESIYYANSDVFNILNYLIIGGEALDKATVNKLNNSTKKPSHFLNGYGPTESTTFTSVFDLFNDIKGINVPIGRPIGNRKVYVLDNFRQPVAIGAI